MSFENTTDWLLEEVRLASVHCDYLPSGRATASLTFTGHPALVRQLIDRFAVRSEEGQAKLRARAEQAER